MAFQIINGMLLVSHHCYMPWFSLMKGTILVTVKHVNALIVILLVILIIVSAREWQAFKRFDQNRFKVNAENAIF